MYIYVQRVRRVNRSAMRERPTDIERSVIDPLSVAELPDIHGGVYQITIRL